MFSWVLRVVRLSKNQQKGVIALNGQGTQQQRPEWPVLTALGMRVNTGYINSTVRSNLHVVMQLKVSVLCVQIAEALSFLHKYFGATYTCYVAEGICIVCLDCRGAKLYAHFGATYTLLCIYRYLFCVFRLPRR